ncbi:hypothetical protein GF354_02840 [Candidatus Peregrinibacteria bacterium]|nr:hypothetical protein [Candidatus Peregrinibacteria bacterium]
MKKLFFYRFLCNEDKNGNNVVVSIVGFGFGFESLSIIDGGIIVFRPDDVVILTHMIPKNLREIFYDKHLASIFDDSPIVDFATSEWSELNANLEAKYTKLINNEDETLVLMLEYLDGIAKTIK